MPGIIETRKKFYTLDEAEKINPQFFRGYCIEDRDCFIDLVKFFKNCRTDVKIIREYLDLSIFMKDSGNANTIGLACISNSKELSTLASLLDYSKPNFATISFKINKMPENYKEMPSSYIFNLEKKRGFFGGLFLPKLDVDTYLMTKEQFERANE
jgi:hypothetical protein